MAEHQPLVLEGLDLSAAIDYLLRRQDALTTLVVCCSREAFIRSMRAASTNNERQHGGEEAETLPPKWSTPTLRLLASSRTIRLAFCPSLPHLRAYFASYPLQEGRSPDLSTASSSTGGVIESLVVLNSLRLHRPTSAFSAQGLNRTFSLAVEAAAFSNHHLLFIECPMSETDPSNLEQSAEENVQDELGLEATNPWDEEVSILNVTTKSFGIGERGWVGRTVTIRQIAARWCIFKRL